MTPERWQRVKSPAARDAFVGAAGDSPSVIAEVRELLSGDAQAGSVSGPRVDFKALSPDAQWVIGSVTGANRQTSLATNAWPVEGGRPISLCYGGCYVDWSPDGTFSASLS